MTTTIPDDVTTVLTSCGRWDFLVVSLDTFLAHHKPGRFILVEDSADYDFAARIQERYPQIEVVLNDPRLGQHKAIDRVYAMIDTPYILHLEDDWHFLGEMDIADGIRVLDSNPAGITAVCFARFTGLKKRQRIFGRKVEHDGRPYMHMGRSHREWHGFSFYPSVLRKDLWVEHGPYAKFQNERAISKHMKAAGKEMVYQLPGIGVHVGSGKSVYDPARANENRRVTGAFWSRLFGRKRYFFDKG
ncbi:MAG: glycosyltransferase [Rhizobiaceae bacterium]|nr:glycosyltransferase [Rhizobiaceae bacterium]